MDLYAYSQIDNLKHTAEKNNIVIPRLRGYRLMSDMEICTPEDIESTIQENICSVYRRAVTSYPRFRPDSAMSEYSPATERLCEKYLIYDENNYVVGIHWEKLHGKNKKAIKFACKKMTKAVQKNLNTYNKYVGREDVMCIHARIGGDNWLVYGGAEIETQPWFLEKVDDFFDNTYCDIYVKIKN